MGDENGENKYAAIEKALKFELNKDWKGADGLRTELVKKENEKTIENNKKE
jgi:hypothetical protein